MSVCPYNCISEVHSGRNSLNFLFETFTQPIERTHTELKSVKLWGNLLKDQYAILVLPATLNSYKSPLRMKLYQAVMIG